MSLTPLAVAPAAIITLLAIVLIIAAIVVFLLATILELRKIVAGLDVVIGPVGEIVSKTAPVNPLVNDINDHLTAGTNLLEGLLVKKAGHEDAAGVIESLFPGGGVAFKQRTGRRGAVKNVGEVYNPGAAQLIRLGRQAPLGTPMSGPAMRDAIYASAAARTLYADPRAGARGDTGGAGTGLPRSPVIGSDAPAPGSGSGMRPRRARSEQASTPPPAPSETPPPSAEPSAGLSWGSSEASSPGEEPSPPGVLRPRRARS